MAEKLTKAERRRLIIQRAQGRCEYCRSPSRYSMQPFAVEHITPKSKGGTDDLNNMAWSCQGCNNHKYNKTHAVDPVTGQEHRLFHPRLDVWSRHFSWNEDATLIIGSTPIARATLDTVRMNRSGLINLRRLLVAANEHPPDLPLLQRS